MRALPLLVLALACRGVVEPAPVVPASTLTLKVFAYLWPDSIKAYNGLDNENGFAGFEIVVTDSVAGVVRHHRFDASDLDSVMPYQVPDSGTAYATLRLTQRRQIVAAGVARWNLQPGTEWTIELQRSPYPHGRFIEPTDDLTKPEYLCWGWGSCHHIWRFDISEDGANYPGESLWMTLLSFTGCPEELIICS